MASHVQVDGIQLCKFPPGLGYREQERTSSYFRSTSSTTACKTCICGSCVLACKGTVYVCKKCVPCIVRVLTNDCTIRLLPCIVIFILAIYITTLVTKLEERLATEIEDTAADLDPF